MTKKVLDWIGGIGGVTVLIILSSTASIVLQLL